MSKIRDIPLGERPREKALLYGVNTLSNAELISLIIAFGTKEYSALDVAYELLAKFRGIDGIIKASVSDLTKINGISHAKALKMKAAFLLYERAVIEEKENEVNLKGTEEIAAFFQKKLANSVQEKAYVVVVNGKNKVISIKELFRGTSHKLTISPRMIISNVINIGSRFYIIHNHPSNIAFPSDEDKTATGEVEFLSFSFGVKMIDHLIITKDSYYSMMNEKEMQYLK